MLLASIVHSHSLSFFFTYMRGRDDKKYETTLPRNTDTFSVSHYPLEVFLRLLLLLISFYSLLLPKKEYIYIFCQKVTVGQVILNLNYGLKRTKEKKKSQIFFSSFYFLTRPCSPRRVISIPCFDAGQYPSRSESHFTCMRDQGQVYPPSQYKLVTGNSYFQRPTAQSLSFFFKMLYRIINSFYIYI